MSTPALIDCLRARIAELECAERRHTSIPFELTAADERIPGGGSRAGRFTRLREVRRLPTMWIGVQKGL
ncbi:hypothetical protein NED98_17155 [Sphingomonas sp. MMSM20]|nr:hypothetical protein [Sphingomonas lycopersici]